MISSLVPGAGLLSGELLVHQVQFGVVGGNEVPHGLVPPRFHLDPLLEHYEGALLPVVPAESPVEFLGQVQGVRDLVADGIGVFIGVGAAALVRFGVSSRQRWPEPDPPAI